MNTLLIFAIVVLSTTICIVAGFWYYGEREARKHNTPPSGTAIRRTGNDPWVAAVRAARDRR